MRRFSVLALTLLVLFASVLPSVLARETNAERLRRGDPPLPPSRREVEKRSQTSPWPRREVEQRSQPSPWPRREVEKRHQPSPRALREVEKRHQPSPRALREVEKRHQPSPRALREVEKRHQPSPRALREVEKRHQPSPRALREAEKRHQPSPVPRDTNADRLRRGSPPLPPARREVEKRSQASKRSEPSKRSQPSPHPPSRREAEKRHQPSQKPRDSGVGLFKRNYPLVTPQRPTSKPSQTVSGVLEIRDHSGARQVGFVENQQCHFPLIGVTDPSAAKTDRLEATFSSDARTIVANSAFLGPDFLPDLTDPNAPPEDILITSALDSSEANVWSYDPITHEITINLPQPNGSTVPAVFVWDKFQNALLLVTDWPAFQATAAKSGPLFDREPELVRLFLVDPN